MAQCKWCGRSGLFLSVSTNGLCSSCDPVIRIEVQNRARIINDSRRLIDESKRVDTRVSRCDLLLEHADALLQYEKRGIPTIQPLPSQFLRAYGQERETIIREGVRSEVESALAKAELATTTKTKINHLSKALLKVREYKTKADDAAPLEEEEKKLTALIHQVQLSAYLEEARKAEFMGQQKKALDRYYEALYFLKHDDIDDSLQEESISSIEAKIAELGGGA